MREIADQNNSEYEHISRSESMQHHSGTKQEIPHCLDGFRVSIQTMQVIVIADCLLRTHANCFIVQKSSYDSW